VTERVGNDRPSLLSLIPERTGNKISGADFMKIVSKSEEPLVIVAEGGVFSVSYQYLTAYKGLVFFTKSKESLQLGGSVEIMTAEKIWIPG